MFVSFSFLSGEILIKLLQQNGTVNVAARNVESKIFSVIIYHEKNYWSLMKNTFRNVVTGS